MTAARPTRIAAAAAVCLLTVTGCSSPSSTASSTATTQASAASSATASASAQVSTITSTPSLNADGYVEKKLGEEGALTDQSNAITARFKVLQIKKNLTCNSGFAEKPKNGHYIGLLMDVTTTTAMTRADIAYFNTNQWSVVDSSGVEENDTAGNAYSCLSESETLPTQITRPMHRKGWVVLDVKNTSGTLRLTQDGLTGGWQYSF